MVILFTKDTIRLCYCNLVFPTKYRKKVLTKTVDITLKDISIEISERYEIKFLEISTDDDHVHFLIQSIPTMPVSKIAQTIKSITARELFQQHKEIKNSYGVETYGQADITPTQ